MPPMSAENSNSEIAELFAMLEAQQSWGTLTFQFKNGKVVHISYHQDFLTLGAAQQGLSRTMPTHKEDPGGSYASQDLYQNGRDSQT